MKILLVNKFLHPNGGAETYLFKLGAHLQSLGHSVEYFGMEHAGRVVGNRVNAYTTPMDFHGGSRLSKLTYPVKAVYSSEARRKLRLVLEDFQPDVCHLNNFHYQLTPSIILEIRKWEKQTGNRCRILYTAHDYQLVCPNHMCYDPNRGESCEKCLTGGFGSCIRGRCIHGSLAKSVVGALEATLWNRLGVYRQIDTVICCSEFMKKKLDMNPVLAEKTVVLRNFVELPEEKSTEKEDYVLYFGRYAPEKGIDILIRAARELPRIPFVFAGAGTMEPLLSDIPNIRNVGFQQKESLVALIRGARFSVYPSRWYENCPLSVLESLALGTPVLGADIGGIPELVRPGVNGSLFESGNAASLKTAIVRLWENPETLSRWSKTCAADTYMTPARYCDALLRYYL